MSLGLLAPLGLAALAALALPLLLHLVRRERQDPVVFAALRWLAARTRPRRRLRLQDWPLLLLRLALVALLALWLAEPVQTEGDDTPVLAVHPALDPARLPLPDEDGTRRVWLAPGFPPLDGAVPAAGASASLLRQLDAELAPGARLSAWVPPILDGLDGERPRLARPVDWRVAGGDALRAMTTPGSPPPITLWLRDDPPAADALPVWPAVAAAWRRAPDGEAPRLDLRDDDDPGTRAAAAWLARAPAPAAFGAGCPAGGLRVLGAEQAWPPGVAGEPGPAEADGRPAWRSGWRGGCRWLQFTRRFDPADWPAVLSPDFPARLQALLQPAPAPTRAEAVAMAPLRGAEAFPPLPRPLSPGLAWLVLALFALERWLAAGRAGSAPA